jgi:hypothetical protein
MKFLGHAILPDLVEFIDGDLQGALRIERSEKGGDTSKDAPVIEAEPMPDEPEASQGAVCHGEALGFCGGTRCTDDVYVTLKELTIAPSSRSIRSPDRGDLPASERQSKIRMHRHHASEGHGQVVAQGQIHLTLSPGFATFQDLVDQLFVFSILPKERFNPLKRRGVQGKETVLFERGSNGIDHPQPVLERVWKEVAGSFWEMCGHVSSGGSISLLTALTYDARVPLRVHLQAHRA